MHTFLRLKPKTVKKGERKEKHTLSCLSNYQLKLQIPGDSHSGFSGIKSILVFLTQL